MSFISESCYSPLPTGQLGHPQESFEAPLFHGPPIGRLGFTTNLHLPDNRRSQETIGNKIDPKISANEAQNPVTVSTDSTISLESRPYAHRQLAATKSLLLTTRTTSGNTSSCLIPLAPLKI